jgi:hypothetical protein
MLFTANYELYVSFNDGHAVDAPETMPLVF